MSEQAEEVKKLEITTVEQALELVFQSFMQNATWFASGVKATDNVQSARYILSQISSRLDAMEVKPDNKEGKILC